MWQATCKCNPIEFIVLPYTEDSVDEELGVIVYPDGEVSNRYGDGTVGIGPELRAEAEDCEDAYCPTCLSPAKWIRS